MKIYIVTRGSYEDYYIDKVFTDKYKAEEYRKWCNDANDLEVYETEDNCQYEKYYGIYINYIVRDKGKNPEPKIQIEKYIDTQAPKNYTKIIDYHSFGYDYFTVIMSRYVPAENWSEDFYINKYTKTIYDVAKMVIQKLREEFTERQINEILKTNSKINKV